MQTFPLKVPLKTSTGLRLNYNKVRLSLKAKFLVTKDRSDKVDHPVPPLACLPTEMITFPKETFEPILRYLGPGMDKTSKV